MRCLLGERWQDGILDPHRGAAEVRIQVLAWLRLERLDDLYFQRPRSLRLVWNYAREIGVRATLTKIASRHEERFRNDCYLAAGLGRVLDAPADAGLAPGAMVEFVAPRHPAAAERVVVARPLVRPAALDLAVRLDPARLLLLERGLHASPVVRAELRAIAGWSPASGAPLDPSGAATALEGARAELREARWASARPLAVSVDAAVIAERSPRSDADAGQGLRATLFGYGNYAKTAILPNLPRSIRVTSIHEVDPLQMPRALSRPVRGGHRVAWDTAPDLRPGESPDVAFIAGFHHTHAALAAAVLGRGGVAVVEKPLVTTEADLRVLGDALGASSGRLFGCFHKRYSPFNAFALDDLGVRPGDAISYHCLVYEVPLPARHWYRWASSRSCIVSNGCHWLDHFLFLNDYAPVREASLVAAPDGSVACTATLVNDAFFSMTLTHRGSERLGVRDHVELRAGGVTVTIENGASYRAEGRDRVLRVRRQNRLATYATMYRAIGEAIVAGAPGDSLRSIEESSRLALRFDELLLARTTSPAAPERRPSPLAAVPARRAIAG